MTPDTIDELRAYHGFLTDKVNANGNELSPEEALDEWRRLHPPSQAFAEEIAAIREALDDVADGDHGIPFAQFDHDFRQRHNLRA